jgi:hypothetical protein
MRQESDSDLDAFLAEFVNEAAKRAPSVFGCFERAMIICFRRQLPKTAEVILREVRFIADGSKEARRWSEPLQIMLVRAASCQTKVMGIVDEIMWRKLLKIPMFSDIAFQSLAHTPNQMIELLSEWWEVQEDPGAAKSLERLMKDVWRTTAHEPLINNLRHSGAVWPISLKKAVNEVLQKNGLPIAFRPFEPVQA